MRRFCTARNASYAVAGLLAVVIMGFGFANIYRIIKKNVEPRENSYAALSETDLREIGRRVGRIRDQVARDAAGMRATLRDRLILDRDVVAVSRQPARDNRHVIEARFYGIKVQAVLQASPRGKRCLLAYFEGHRGNPFKFKHHESLQRDVLDHGCDMISFSMIGLGLNEGPASFPINMHDGEPYQLHLNPQQARKHSTYSFFHDPRFPGKDPLALFLSGHYWILDSLAKDYERIDFVGISGGGWYVTLMSALFPKLSSSVSVAGTMPRLFKADVSGGKSNMGDFEQSTAPILREYDYFHFYFLGGLGDGRRKVYLIYNDRDSCCFRDPSASRMKRILEQVGGVAVIVNHRSGHDIDAAQVFSILYR